MSKYRVLQITNKNILATQTNSNLLLGQITRRIQENCCENTTFNVSTTQADTIFLNESGNYNVFVSTSLNAESAGIVSIALFANNVNLYEVSETASVADNTVNLNLAYQIRVCPNCESSPNNSPLAIQIKLTGGAITGGQSNLIIERVY